MAVTVTHAHVTAVPDDPAYDIGSDEWNADHTVVPPASDSESVLFTKNTSADNVLNGDFQIVAHAYDVNASGRLDQVYRLGYNMAEPGTGKLSGQPSIGFHWESFYEAGGNEYTEFHIAQFNGSGDEFRWDSWSQDYATDFIQRSSQFDKWAWRTGDGVDVSAILTNNATNPTLDLNNGFLIRSGTNGDAVFQQLDAAGTAYLSLPYYNSDNRLVVSNFVCVGSTPSSGTYANALAVIQSTSASAGATVLYLQGPTITGDQTIVDAAGSASSNCLIRIYNQNNTSTSAQAMLLLLASATYCDPVVLFRINGATDWCIGTDNSDSDKFKISKAASLGSSDALAIDTSLHAYFGGCVATAAVTVANLPTGVQGMRSFVTDATQALTAGIGAVVAGGGANAVPVHYDGTNWRIG